MAGMSSVWRQKCLEQATIAAIDEHLAVESCSRPFGNGHNERSGFVLFTPSQSEAVKKRATGQRDGLPDDNTADVFMVKRSMLIDSFRIVDDRLRTRRCHN